MNQDYLAALWHETTAWNDLEQGLREQRQAIINRKVDEVWHNQDRLQELVRQAAGCRLQTSKLRPVEVEGEVKVMEAQVQALREQVRQAMSFNFELLRDVCSYLEMVREVAFPHTIPPTYRHPREGGSNLERQTLTGTRIA